MYKDFEDMPDQSRVWCYMADRRMKEDERSMVASKLEEFCSRWVVHGQPVDTSFEVFDHQFLILTASEQHMTVSGCSIDSSVKVVRELGGLLGIDFFDRSRAPLVLSGEINLIKISDLRQKYRDGIWNSSTPTFNILAATLGEIRKAWQIPASKSWLRRYVDPERSRSLAG